MFVYEDKVYDQTIPLYATLLIALSLVLIVGFFICLSRQPMVVSSASFKVPLVPFIPLLSVFSNIYLMAHLATFTWIRFAVWMVIGFIIYFTYGIVKSVGYLTQTERCRLSLEGSVNEGIEEFE